MLLYSMSKSAVDRTAGSHTLAAGRSLGSLQEGTESPRKDRIGGGYGSSC
jgi:hypothetical protein